jgi:hypothetical protein
MEVVDTPPKIGRLGKNYIYIGKLIKLYKLSLKFVNETKQLPILKKTFLSRNSLWIFVI